MNLQIAREEYMQALRQGLKDQKALLAAGKNPYPAVLDEIVSRGASNTQDLGVLEIPSERIVGTVSVGRTGAFTAGFMPLLDDNSEFATKWISLCAAHLGEQGIRDPILCYEYLGNFYVQEGNKRCSVLRHFGAPRITAHVMRLMPGRSEEPRIRAYYEFLEFYASAKMYAVQYRRPGDYARLLAFLGKEPGESWDERERRTFQSYFQYFCEAFAAQKQEFGDLLPEEALLLWLQVYPFRDLGQLTAAQLKKTVAGLSAELKTLAQDTQVRVQTQPSDTKASILSILNPAVPDYVRVAFVHVLSPEQSQWITGHDRGREYLEQVLGEQVRVRSYFHADSPAMAETLMEQAITEGAQLVITTTPQLSRSTLRMAVKYPRVKFLNCGVNLPYSSLRSFYGRMYEAKFIAGAIAGAMSADDGIGYIASSPIWGEIASINAFALGAQLTNPRAHICLRWSCLPGNHEEEFLAAGIRVVSNREVPEKFSPYLYGCSYGTYVLDDEDMMQPLASPVWVWGKFYESAVRAIMAGTWEKDSKDGKAVNYWLGMESGLIDIRLAENLPVGVEVLAKTLQKAVIQGDIHPFSRKILAQDGRVVNDGSHHFTPEELLHMDWLCENVDGSIPQFSELLPVAKALVREQGIYREMIPKEKEGAI